MTATMQPTERLTPERLESVSFAPARLGRRGVDESQVRGFLSWVSAEVIRMLNERAALEAEVRRLRSRVLESSRASGYRPDDGHAQAIFILSKAQQTADQYVANAQDYSKEIAEDAKRRHDEILAEAQSRASAILDEAQSSARQAADMVPTSQEPLTGAQRRDLEAELAYLRTYSDVCRTHLRAYLESLTRSIEEWERAEGSARAAATRGLHHAQS